jgi:uncharacterized protein (DUF1778 family)
MTTLPAGVVLPELGDCRTLQCVADTIAHSVADATGAMIEERQLLQRAIDHGIQTVEERQMVQHAIDHAGVVLDQRQLIQRAAERAAQMVIDQYKWPVRIAAASLFAIAVGVAVQAWHFAKASK